MIRQAVPDDAPAIRAIYGWYVEHTAVTFDYETPSEEEFRKRIEETLPKYPYLVLVEDGRIRGYACARAFVGRAAYAHCAETTIYLDRDARGRGLGRMLYGALENGLKERGFRNLCACIGDPIAEDETLTHASERFHQSCGYEKVGTFHRCGYKFGRWYNMIWMEKMIGDHPEKSGEGDSV